MANTNAMWQQVAHTTQHQSSPSCSTRAIQKIQQQKTISYWHTLGNFLEKFRRMDHNYLQKQQNDKTEEEQRDQKNKRVDSKEEWE